MTDSNTRFINSGQNGQLRGWDISKVRDEHYWLIFTRTIFAFDLNAEHPLTWIDRHGDKWQPNRSFESDGGTFPSNPFLSNFRFLWFFFHDSAYRAGGLWRAPLTRPDHFTFRKLTRLQIDEMLLEGMYSDPEPASMCEALTVYRFVRTFGGLYYHPDGGGDLKKKG